MKPSSSGQDNIVSSNVSPSKPQQNQQNNNINLVDRQSIAEEYRSLRQKHQDWLSKINLTENQKKQLFGFSDSYYCTNKAEHTKLVCVQDFFRGKLIMKEEAWKKINRLKRNKKKQQPSHNIHQNKHEEKQFAKLDISLDESPHPILTGQKQGSNDKLLDFRTNIFATEPKDDDLSIILSRINQFDEGIAGKQKPINKNIDISSIHHIRNDAERGGKMAIQQMLKHIKKPK